MLPLLRQAVLALTVAAVLGGGWLLFAWSGDAALEERGGPGARGGGLGPALVGIEAVTPATTMRRFEGIGTGKALRSVVLHARTSGRVVELGARAGARVEAGDVVLRLDDEEERLAVERAEIELAEAEQTLRRYERLEPSGAVSTSEVDQARLGLARARTDLAAAELALEHRRVRAPFDGVLGLPGVDVGDRVDTSTALVSLDDRSTLLVDFDVPERLAGNILPGISIEASTASLAGAGFEGVIEAADSRLDADTRSLRVRAAIDNEDDRLRPGMAFTIRVALPGEEHLSVPDVAVQWGRTGAHVWRVEEGVVRRVPVTIVQRQADRVVVEGEIAAEEAVVVEGLQRLREGAPVVIAGERHFDAGARTSR